MVKLNQPKSDEFEEKTGLRQGGALSSARIIVTLEIIIRKIQNTRGSLNIRRQRGILVNMRMTLSFYGQIKK